MPKMVTRKVGHSEALHYASHGIVYPLSIRSASYYLITRDHLSQAMSAPRAEACRDFGRLYLQPALGIVQSGYNNIWTAYQVHAANVLV
jgi:hypothetical protein